MIKSIFIIIMSKIYAKKVLRFDITTAIIRMNICSGMDFFCFPHILLEVYLHLYYNRTILYPCILAHKGEDSMLRQDIKDSFLQILREELIPAMGCTEPIALALAAAKAAVELKGKPEYIRAQCSGNIIKNVRCVRIPNSGGMTGIEAACVLGALCGAYLSVASGMDAAAAACAVMGISGQMAQTEKGSGSFMVRLMDALSTLTDKELENLIDLEETTYETL